MHTAISTTVPSPAKVKKSPFLPHIISRKAVPIVDIIANLPSSPQRIHFCYRVLDRALTSLLSNQYADFDAHTTSNCCHGMALLVQELILLARQENLEKLHQEVKTRLNTKSEDPSWTVPKPLVKLAHLYILNYILEVTPKTIRSEYKNLLDIAAVEVKFCNKLMKTLQEHYGNIVALRYEQYLRQVSGKIQTCGVPVEMWGKYASHAYLRSDDRGLYYAASLYSMQIVLAYQSYAKAKIAVVNDILDDTGKMSRYIRILQGDGKGNFSLVDSNAASEGHNDPVVVFCACAKTNDPNQISRDLDGWLHQFPNLVLAHELTYPQFPNVNSEFHSQPIVPEEDLLQNLMIDHGQINGVSSKDPSFYCLNHIYTSSVRQMLGQPDPDPHSLRILSTVIIG